MIEGHFVGTQLARHELLQVAPHGVDEFTCQHAVERFDPFGAEVDEHVGVDRQ